VRTWKIEMAIVAAILLIVNVFTNKIFTIEILAALAVLLTFGHAQISIRLSEQEALAAIPKVDCYQKLIYYYVGKEIFWFLYFWMNHSYSALIGVIVFLFYPVWRRFKNDRKNKMS
jgi:hypothetical protein